MLGLINLIMGTGIGMYLGYNLQKERTEKKKEDRKNVRKRRV